jgi:glycosyltransferase involved in cell wall biosynthesis
MRVLFDAAPATFTPGGIATYIDNLSHHLALQIDVDVRVSRLPHWLAPDGTRGLRHKLRVLGWDTYYTHRLLPSRSQYIQADLLHASALRLPFRSGITTVVTVHDVIPLLYPGLYRFRDRLTLQSYLRLGARRAAHIITNSEHTRSDVQRLLSVPRERMTVTPLGVADIFQPLTSAQSLAAAQEYGVTQPYILSVCTLEPRKNLLRVLEAFALLRKRCHTTHRLVLVGRRGWLEDPIFAAVQRLEIEDAVHFTGYVPINVLPALYSGATVFVYPSLYEGFGFPVLEAMRCGCPVITSNVSSLPEVGGSAACYVDPYNVTHLADALERVLDDPEQAQRMREQGLEHAGMFSWERCTRQTLEVYRQVLRNENRSRKRSIED